MSLLTQYTPHSSLFASPLGVLITQGCLARQSYVNDRQPLVRAAQDLFKHHAQSDIIVGLLPFNTSRAAQLLESKKDQQEHAIVIENIIEALAPFCDSIEAAKTPHLISTATLWHLSTEIRGQLKALYADALTLALAIHPTPAVCGHPTKEARDHIEAIEQQDRGFFAGAVGWINRSLISKGCA